MNGAGAMRLTGSGGASGSFCQDRTFTRASRNDLDWSEPAAGFAPLLAVL